MRKALLIAITLALLTTPAMSRVRHIVTDTIIPERIVVKSSLFGITLLNNLDTYLSNYNHKGLGINFSHENFRDARTGNYRWKYQTLFNATLGYATLGNNIQYTALISQSWSGYHPFKVAKGLTLLAGAQIQLEGGALYNPGNGNNPAAAKLRTALAATGMAIYHFPVLRSEWIARYQVDIPLAGVMFAPEFGQSYYEIFGLGHTDGIVSIAHPFNAPSWRHTLSLDIPLRYKRHSTTIRLQYCADMYQSDINSIRCHIYRHAFTFGFAKTILKVKQENSIKAYSPY
jgi:hypothetical protein